jgi:hypothetical protein
VTYTPTDIANYSPVTSAVNVMVKKASLIITASSPTMTYGGIVPSIMPGYNGLQAGDTAPTTAPTCSTTATSTSPVGLYPSNCLGAMDANYTISYNPGSVSITPATPTVTWSNPADITYGTALSALQLDATATVPGTFTYSPVSGTILLPGDGQILTVNFFPTNSTNYTSVLGTTVTIKVLKATLTVTAIGINKVYDGTTTASVTLTDNRVAGDSIIDSYTAASFLNADIGTGKTVNVIGISISGVDAGNYILGNKTATTIADIIKYFWIYLPLVIR